MTKANLVLVVIVDRGRPDLINLQGGNAGGGNLTIDTDLLGGVLALEVDVPLLPVLLVSRDSGHGVGVGPGPGSVDSHGEEDTDASSGLNARGATNSLKDIDDLVLPLRVLTDLTKGLGLNAVGEDLLGTTLDNNLVVLDGLTDSLGGNTEAPVELKLPGGGLSGVEDQLVLVHAEGR